MKGPETPSVKLTNNFRRASAPSALKASKSSVPSRGLDYGVEKRITPLKVVIQEDKNIIWAVLGNKLFRIAPEHARRQQEKKFVIPNLMENESQQESMEKLRAGNSICGPPKHAHEQYIRA